MADAIPVADPGLLAAQSKAGQAGVDAYNAAISTLQQQKQNAVQTALQEAAMRGAPTGAAQSQAGIINAPYDTRIASLTQNLGGYQAAQEARSSRMADYNAAVMAAREYIPEQVRLATAPINAQADYAVRRSQIEGEQNVAGINAETELTLARMAAALQAAKTRDAKAAAAKKAAEQKLNQGELTALMSQRGAEALTGRADQIRQILSANEAATKKAAQDTAASNKASQDKATNQNYWDLMAASYTGKAVQEEQRKTPTTLNAIRSAAVNADRVPLPMQVSAGNVAQAQNTADIIGYDRYSGRPIYGATGQNPAGMVPGGPNPVAGAGLAAMSMWNSINQNASRLRGITAGQQSVRDLASGVVQRQKETGANLLGSVMGSIRDSNAKYSAIDSQTGRRAYMTPDQVEGLDPMTREMLMGATQIQGINGLQDFEDLVVGAPSERNRGIANPYSSTVVRDAMLEVAKSLQDQGYAIDEAQIRNALPGKIPSLYNLLAGQSDQLSSEDAYQAAEAAAADAAKAAATDEKATTKADEAEASAGLRGKYGRTPPKELGPAADVLQTIVDNQPQLESIRQAIRGIVNSWDTQRGGIGPGQIRTQLMQSDMDPALLPLIDTALYMEGF